MKKVIRHTLLIGFVAVALGFFNTLQAQSAHSGSAGMTDCPLYIPNAFTPNGDDLNETFYLKYSEDCQMLEFNIRIFDRWGRKVFESDSPHKSKSWNGKMDNEDLQAGVYLYKVHAKMVNINKKGKPHIIDKQGSVVLIR